MKLILTKYDVFELHHLLFESGILHCRVIVLTVADVGTGIQSHAELIDRKLAIVLFMRFFYLNLVGSSLLFCLNFEILEKSSDGSVRIRRTITKTGTSITIKHLAIP